jgi:hypothetical protein
VDLGAVRIKCIFSLLFFISHRQRYGSFIQGIRPGPRLLVVFRNTLIFYGEELLDPRPTPKLDDHPLSAVRDCLYNIFAATLQNWGACGSVWVRNLVSDIKGGT